MPENPAAARLPDDERGLPRLGTLGGDRLCLDCQYNLKHQPYWRERRYGLLMVRCPECGRAAALMDQPCILVSWYSRSIAWLIAIPWCVLMLAYLLAIAGAAFGMAMLSTMVALEPLMYGGLPQGWLGLNWLFVLPLGLACVLAFTGGLVWRVLTCGEGRWAARWSIVGLVLLQGLFGWLTIEDWRSAMMYSNYYATLAGVGPILLTVSLCLSLVAHGLGLVVGRTVGRWGLRLMRSDVEHLPGLSAR